MSIKMLVKIMPNLVNSFSQQQNGKNKKKYSSFKASLKKDFIFSFKLILLSLKESMMVLWLRRTKTK